MTELIAARRRFVVFVALFFFVVALLTNQVRSPDRRQVGPLGTAMLTVLMPIQAEMVRLVDATARLWALYTEIGRLRVENTRLHQQVDTMAQEMSRLREQALAAQRLERLLQFRGQIIYRTTAARVVGRTPTAWFNTMVVDRGAADGIHRNAPVITTDGVLGRVIEVTPTTSRVLLIADSRSAVGVLIQRSREAGLVEGRGGKLLHFKYLSGTTPVQVGDVVVTSGLGGVFPRGLIVGRVTKVVKEEGALLQEAEVEPAAPLDRVEEVLILLPK